MINRSTGSKTDQGLIRVRPKLSSQAEREMRRDTPLRQARTCYGHLAGVAGVALLDDLLGRGWLVESPTPATGSRVGYDLTEQGRLALEALGLDTEAAAQTSGNFAFGCLDWTERRQHLGGALGRAVTAHLGEKGVVARTPGVREVSLKSSPEAWLEGAAPSR
ncbi:MAG: hypothetical protein O3A93_02235 [Chloroflexi bacterium]|nr:hypothetical protein [Chloroflexota bacterium]MDA1270066.1 hypothetical protein [Chloroflexota bacterium]